GGGGFLLFHEAKTSKTFAVDFRERAPRQATERMYLDARGEVIEGASTVGARSSAVPGLVAGLAELHARFGRIPFSATVRYAVELAEKGIDVYPYLGEALEEEKATLAKFPSSRRIFLKSDGTPYQ